MKSQPLLVHLLFHPESAAGRELACHVHRQLNGDLIEYLAAADIR